MILNGEQVDINKWEPPGESYRKIFGEGWRSFKEYNSNLPENTPTSGYRIFYKEGENYYSPFTHGGINNVGKHPEKRQQIGVPLQSPTENGYYYFRDRDVTENYLYALLVQTITSMKKDPTFRPTGSFQIHRVEGIAAGPAISNDEGDRMKEMLAYDDPYLIIHAKELWPKPDVDQNTRSAI